MRWSYQGTDAAGRELSGLLDAASEDEARAQLRSRGLWLTALQREGNPTADGVSARAGGWRNGVLGWWGTDRQELAVLTRSVAALLEAGVSLDGALAAASELASPRWRSDFDALRAAVRRGASLSEAVSQQRRFPSLFAPMLAAAEATGQLARQWMALAEHLEQGVDTDRRVRGALAYPLLLAAASTVATIVLLVVVVPRFAMLLGDTSAGGVPLPLATRILLGTSAFLRTGGWSLLALLALGVGIGARALSDPLRRRQWDAWRLGLPIVGGYEWDRDAGRYLTTLGLALEAGVPLLPAMTLARGTMGNGELADRFAATERAVQGGRGLAEVLGPVLPPMARPLLDAGERSGSLGEMARRAGRLELEGARGRVETAVRLLEPVLILGFGAVVAAVALGLLQAIYRLNAIA